MINHLSMWFKETTDPVRGESLFIVPDSDCRLTVSVFENEKSKIQIEKIFQKKNKRKINKSKFVITGWNMQIVLMCNVCFVCGCFMNVCVYVCESVCVLLGISCLANVCEATFDHFLQSNDRDRNYERRYPVNVQAKNDIYVVECFLLS